MKQRKLKIFMDLKTKFSNNKKAQIRMMETIAILLIFFVIVIIAFMFYIKTASVGQSSKITKIQELESIRISQAISFLPELQCSSKNIIKDNCFDKLKMVAFESLNSEPGFDAMYYDMFYFSTITVNETYPDTSNSWELYDRELADSPYFVTSIPILLYDPVQRTNAFGLLNVKHYTQ
jgi:hypothetical protein